MNWERKSCAISTVPINEWRLFWGAVPDLKVVWHACDTAILMVIIVIIVVVIVIIKIRIFDVHAQYNQFDDRARGLWDVVDTVFFLCIIVWIWGWCQYTILSYEIATTCTKVITKCGNICWFISHLESHSALKQVRSKSENDDMINSISISKLPSSPDP